MVKFYICAAMIILCHFLAQPVTSNMTTPLEEAILTIYDTVQRIRPTTSEETAKDVITSIDRLQREVEWRLQTEPVHVRLDAHTRISAMLDAMEYVTGQKNWDPAEHDAWLDLMAKRQSDARIAITSDELDGHTEAAEKMHLFADQRRKETCTQAQANSSTSAPGSVGLCVAVMRREIVLLEDALAGSLSRSESMVEKQAIAEVRCMVTRITATLASIQNLMELIQ